MKNKWNLVRQFSLTQFDSTVIQDATGPQGNAGFKQFIPRT